MDFPDSAGRLKIRRLLHLGEQVDDGKAAGDIVRDLEEGLLVHLSRVRMIAAEAPDLGVKLLQELGIDDAGMAVVLDDHRFLVRASGVQFLTADQAAFPDGIRGCAEGNQGLCLAAALVVIGQHGGDLLIGLRIHHVQPGMEDGKRGKMLVAVDEGRDQGLVPQVRDRG